jgi:hypothetical protein
MIEQTGAAPNQGHIKQRNVLSMVKADRMAGSVPRWAAPETPTQHIQETLERASLVSDPSDAQNSANFQTALSQTKLSYAGNASASDIPPAQNPEEFTAGDLVDMINPLHHIPVVGGLYRELTGDEIKPIGQIIGGAVFGGPIGAASGAINVALKAETGEDMTGHALGTVFGRDKSPSVSGDLNNIQPASGEQDGENTGLNSKIDDLPASLLAFTDQSSRGSFIAQRTSPTALLDMDRRTPDGLMAYDAPDSDFLLNLPAREPITILELSSVAGHSEKRSYNT